MTDIGVATRVHRLLRNEAEYPWERRPWENVAYQVRSRSRHIVSATARLVEAVEAASTPMTPLKERRRTVRVYIGLARDYWRMAVKR